MATSVGWCVPHVQHSIPLISTINRTHLLHKARNSAAACSLFLGLLAEELCLDKATSQPSTTCTQEHNLISSPFATNRVQCDTLRPTAALCVNALASQARRRNIKKTGSSTQYICVFVDIRFVPRSALLRCCTANTAHTNRTPQPYLRKISGQSYCLLH